MQYRYTHFDRQRLRDDAAFRAGPEVGNPLPSFDLPTTDGRRITNEVFVGRPLFLMLGSMTCPMTVSSLDLLMPIYERLQNKVQFLMVYVREAHPGERLPQPQRFEQKLRHAQELVKLHRVPWTVAVDDIEGRFHRMLDSKPNAAYFVDEDGIVVYRSLFSNDPAALSCGFDVLLHRRVPEERESERRLIPMLSGLGAMDQTLGLAGRTAKRDLMRQAPELYAMSKIARAFSPLPPLARGVAAVAALGVVSMVGVTMLARALLRPSSRGGGRALRSARYAWRRPRAGRWLLRGR